MHKPHITAALAEVTKSPLCEEPGFSHWASLVSLHTGYSVPTGQAATHSSTGKWLTSPTTAAAQQGGESFGFDSMNDLQPPSELIAAEAVAKEGPPPGTPEAEESQDKRLCRKRVAYAPLEDLENLV